MADIGSISSTILFGQSARLLIVTDTPNDGDTDRLVLLKNVGFNRSHPEVEESFGLEKVYGHGELDTIITFTLGASIDVYQYLITQNTRNANGVLPTSVWNIVVTGVDGTRQTLGISAKLRDLSSQIETLTPKAAKVDCVLRVTDRNVTIT